MSVEKKFYGYTADQKEISSYTLTNKSGMKAVLLDIGAVIESLLVPDKNGNLVDVVLVIQSFIWRITEVLALS